MSLPEGNPDLSLKSLDIGCGRFKFPGSVGLDIVPLEGVDVVHDLDKFPYPFPSDTFDYIRLSHVVEHPTTPTHPLGKTHPIAGI